MNLTLTKLNGPAPAAKGAAANDATAATAAPATFDAAAAVPGTVDAAQPNQPMRAFAQWLGLDQMAPVDVDATAAVVATDSAPAADDIPVEEQQATDTPLLGAMAMSMPLMPLISTPQATLAAVVAALPGASALPAAKESAPAADTEVSPSLGSTPSGREGRAELAALPAAALPASASAPALPLAETPVQAAVAKTAPAALAADTSAANGDTPQDQAAPVTERGAANIAGMASTSAPAAGTAPRTADTVTLAGPPTAWRQTLQEALGERLQLQVGSKAEQAVIRLEPPMLGRVEIAIRHSAGSLEVQISATHGEVLRQLQTVSESLRSDLAQRQFSDVSVNVVPTPRAANGAPMFAGGEGRGRQQDGRQQEQEPGNALAEANTGFSPFTLNGLSLSGRAQGRS